MGLIDYVLVFTAEFDTEKETERLMKQLKIRALYSPDQVQAELERSKEKYKSLVTKAKVADVADRITSVAGPTLSVILAPFTGGTSLAGDGIEEVVELAIKAPMLYELHQEAHTRVHIPGLVGREIGTFIPVLGDGYDILTNRFLKTAYEVIRDDAKMELLKDH